MKRLIASAASLLALLLFVPAVSAQTVTPSDFSEAVFSVELDREKWDVLVFGENEEEFCERLGVSYDQLRDFLENSGTCVDAMHSEDDYREVTVRKTPVTDGMSPDLRLESREEQERLALEYAAWFERVSGCKCDFVELYRGDQTDYIVYDVIYFASDGSDYFGRRYYTSVGGSNVYIDMYNYRAPLSVDEQSELLGIVDSVKFTGLKSRAFLPTALRVLRWVLIAAVAASAAVAIYKAVQEKKLRTTLSGKQRSRNELEERHRRELGERQRQRGQQPEDDDVISYPGRR